MAGKVVGITIDLLGRSSGLVSSLKSAESELNSCNAALKSVNSSLKLDPSNVDLLTSKSALLGDAIQQNSNKLDVLKDAAAQAMQTLGQEGGATQAQVAELQAEIARTEATLNDLESEAEATGTALDELGTGADGMQELSDNSEDAAGSLQDVETESEGASVALDALGGVAATVGGAMAGAFAAAVKAAQEAGEALVNCTVDAAGYADSMNTLASKTGISTERLQEMDYALGGLIDVSLETVTGSMTKLEKSMSSAAAADEKYYETVEALEEKLDAGKISQEEFNAAVEEAAQKSSNGYEQLGISIKNADGTMRDSEEVFWDVIDALGQMEAGTDRDLLAMDLLGKSAKELNPLIEKGSEGFRQLADEAHEVGYVMDSEELQGFQNFQDQMDRMGKGATAAKNALGGVLLPTLSGLAGTGTDLLNKFTVKVKESDGDISKIGDAVSELLPELFAGINQHMPELFGLIGTVVETLGQILIDNLPMLLDSALQIVTTLADGLLAPDNIAKISGAAIDIILKLVEYLIQNLPAIINAALQILLALVNGITQALPTLIPAVVDAILTITETLTSPENLALILDAALQLIIGLATGLVDALPEIIDRLPEIITGIIDFLLSDDGLGKIAQSGFDLLVGIVQKLPEIIVEIVSGVGDIVAGPDGILNKIGSFATDVWNAFKDLFPSVDDVIGWGKDLIEGIGDGIREGWESFTGAVSGAASYIADNLGFSVPKSGVLHEWAYNPPGKDMVEFYAQGIEDAMPTLENSVDLMANTIATGSAPGVDYTGQLSSINGSIGQLAAASGGPVYVTAYFGTDNMGTVVAQANNNNAFLSGGR